jgi:two-component system, NtrC family, sensor kinase
MRSIRGKIGLAYGALALLGVVFMAIVYADLRYLEQRIGEGVAVSDFRERTLEMRRHEKNYFLYRDPADRFSALELADAVAADMGARRALFLSLLPTSELARLSQSLETYRRLFDVTEGMGADREKAVRTAGHDISATAERLGRQERVALVESVKASTRAMLSFALAVVVLGLLAGQLMARLVARPLRELEAELQPLAEGRFTQFTAPSRDREFVSLTHALNRMLEELDVRRRQVLHAEKLSSMGVLASGVAHELNNPLGNISSAAQILAEEMSAGDANRAWVAQIDSEAERGRRIVRTLLDYARRQDFRPERVALEEVLDKSLLLLGKRRPGGDHLRLDLQPDLAVWVDEQRMQQVFINLLRNALDAGASQLTVSARRAVWGDSRPAGDASLAGAVAEMHDDRRVTIIQIQDNGPGIPAEALPHVFDPFFTTRGAGHGEGHGVGLGLFVVEEIVAEHGGCVAAETLSGGGARFTLWLPCRSQEETNE